MKVYVGGDSGTLCAACVASSVKEAKAMLWNDSDVRDACDGDPHTLRVRRARQYDSVAKALSLPDGVVRSKAALRVMGFWIEGDVSCISCGLYTMGDEFPLCLDCEHCGECGHAEDCGHDPR